MSYFLTEDQKLIVKSVDEFCAQPQIQAMCAEARKEWRFSRELWKAAAEQGYIGAAIPEEYGGMGYDLTTYFLIVEELAKNSFPLCGALAGHSLGMLPLMYWGTEEQKKTWLPGIASGDIVLAGSVTDPAGLCNFPEWGMTDVETADGYKLNATKVMSTNAVTADLKIVFAKPSEGKSLFDHVYVVEKDLPGVETGDQEKKLMPDCGDWGSIVLNDVEVPKDHRIDDNGFGPYWLGPSFLVLALQSLVMGYGAFKSAYDYAAQRTRYGRPLNAIQSVSHKIADMAIHNETSRCLIYTATRLWDEGRAFECYRLACMAKAYVTEGVNKSCHDAVILHGGIGYTIPAMIGPMWVSSIQMELAEMPGDIHRDFIMETYGVKPGWKEGRA